MSLTSFVMPALVAGIHAMTLHDADSDVDSRDKPGHDAPRVRHSQKALWIDVHRNAHAAAFFRTRRQHVAQKALQVRIAWRFDQQTKAIAPAHQSNRRFGGAKHHDLSFFRQAAERRDAVALRRRQGMRRARQGSRMRFRGGGVLRRNDDCGEPSKGRKASAFAKRDFLLVKTFGVAREQRRDHRMLLLIGLNEGAARPVAAPGAARHLIEQLKGALGGARIAAA